MCQHTTDKTSLILSLFTTMATRYTSVLLVNKRKASEREGGVRERDGGREGESEEGGSEKGWRKGRREEDKEREERKVGGREGRRGGRIS